MRIGVQTFTVRHEAKKDVFKTFKRLKSIGIDHIELAYVSLNNETAHAIIENKLNVVSIQATYHRLMHDMESMISFGEKVGCNVFVVSVLPLSSILFGKTALKRFTKKLNQLSKRYEAKGFKLGFHHHDFEFKRIRKKTKLEWILELTHPTIGIVTDTYWTKKAGYDPLVIIKMINQRLMGVHLRDLHHDLKHDAALGTGVIDFSSILNHLAQNSCYQVIEQNSSDPFSDLEQSITYLKA